MKIWVLSDLHVGAKAARAPIPLSEMHVPDADCCVVAGDVCDGAIAALGWIAQTIALRMPVFLVLGNHEFFGETWEAARAEARQVAVMIEGVTLLDDDVAVIDGVRFVGGTLWTDYELYGPGDDNLRARSMSAARLMMPDHNEIDMRSPHRDIISRRFSPRDARNAHRATRAFLDAAMAEPFAGATVVVTHHAPHPLCIHPRFRGDTLSAAFASDLSDLIKERQPQLWIHGHVHDPVDFHVGDTRIVCNPKGYLEENSEFDPNFLVVV